MKFVTLTMLFCIAAAANEKPGVTYKIFQFPANMIPRIDGSADDWAMVPEDYVIGGDQLTDDSGKHPNGIDKKSLDVRVRVGWVKGLNRLYFLYEAYDNYWDFSRTDLHNDIFELVVDGDLSGGPLIPRFHPNKDLTEGDAHYSMHGVAAQKLSHLHAGGRQGLGARLGLPAVDQGAPLFERRLQLQFQARRVREADPGILDHAF